MPSATLGPSQDRLGEAPERSALVFVGEPLHEPSGSRARADEGGRSDEGGLAHLRIARCLEHTENQARCDR